MLIHNSYCKDLYTLFKILLVDNNLPFYSFVAYLNLVRMGVQSFYNCSIHFIEGDELLEEVTSANLVQDKDFKVKLQYAIEDAKVSVSAQIAAESISSLVTYPPSSPKSSIDHNVVCPSQCLRQIGLLSSWHPLANPPQSEATLFYVIAADAPLHELTDNIRKSKKIASLRMTGGVKEVACVTHPPTTSMLEMVREVEHANKERQTELPTADDLSS